MQIDFLSLEDVLVIHADQISRYGGADGVRAQHLLLSAIAQPSSTFDGQYLHATMFDKAAAYLFHICQNHPFVDGNKRTALATTLQFLSMNDHLIIDYDESALEHLTLSVASGKIRKDKIASFLAQDGR